MIRRLRLKFVCINMVLASVMLVLIFTLQYRSTAMSLEQNSLEALQSGAAAVPMMSMRPGREEDSASLPTFTILEVNRGELIVSGDDYFDLTDEELLKEIYLAAVQVDETSAVLEDYALRFYRAETMMGTKYVFADISGELQTLQGLVRSCFFIGIAAFVGFLGISILLARWAVRPVEKAWEQQRQFVADASHELKTPLTVILTNAELLEEEACDPETRLRLTDSILSMSRQMRGLVESLLQLARADNGQMKSEMETLDLGELIQESILPFEPLYYEQDLVLESRIVPGLRVLGSPRHLTQVADILLDNGQKYSAPGSTVVVTVQRSHNRCLLTLFSPGQPLSQTAARDIFKRFYREDKARSAPGSYGLGLSIAQSILRDHRGRIWAEPQAQGNLFCVSLPLV